MAHLNIDERRKAVEEVIKTGFSTKRLKEIAKEFNCSYGACYTDFAYLSNKTGITLYPCPSVKENVRKRDNNTCQYCGEVGGEIIIEHVIPYIYGGLGKEYNLVCACQVCNTKKKSVYVNAHLVTEAARKKYPKDHEYEGHQMPPSKSDTEGGQKFANRCDDFITIHRMTQFEPRKNFTEIHVRKVKETITGGSVTPLDRPLIFKMWNFTRFEIGESNPIAHETGQGTPVQQVLTTLNNKRNEGFETESVQKDADDFPF